MASVGITSAPPKATSDNYTRNSDGSLSLNGKVIAGTSASTSLGQARQITTGSSGGSGSSAANGTGPNQTSQKLPGLTPQQNQGIDQRQGGDLSLGADANQQLAGIQQNFSTPFDYSKYEAMDPTQGDYNNFLNTQMQNYTNSYNTQMDPIIQQQSNDFEQQMAEQGIPVGSDLYNQQKNLMQQSQANAANTAFANDQSQAVTSAQGEFNVGTQAQQNALSLGQAAYNQPLTNYNALYGAQSGMNNTDLGYSQGLVSQNNQIQGQLAGAKIGAGATIGAATIGANASMANAGTAAAASEANAQYPYTPGAVSAIENINAANPQYQQPNPYGTAAVNGVSGLLSGAARNPSIISSLGQTF